MAFNLLFLVPALVSFLLRPKPETENAKPDGLGAFKLSTATEDRVVPLLWGTARIGGPNVIWYGDLIKRGIKKAFSFGLFSKASKVASYGYSLGIQWGLCQGPGVTLRRVWIGEPEVLDATASPITGNETFTIDKPNLLGGLKRGFGGVEGTLRFFDGSASQATSSYLSSPAVESAVIANGGTGYSVDDILTEAGDGTASVRATFTVLTRSVATGEVLTISLLNGGIYTVNSTSPVDTTVLPSGGIGCTLTLTYSDGLTTENGVVPGYHDICHIAPDTEPIGIGTSISIDEWNFEVRRIPNGLAFSGGEEEIDGGANIANVLFEALTNSEWGYGNDSSNINTTNFMAAGATLATEGNGFSFLLDEPEELPTFIQRLEAQMDGLVYTNPLTGLWEISLARGDYEINNATVIDSSNIIEIKAFNRGSWENTTNTVHVPFNDSSDDYRPTFGFAQDMANVFVVGRNVTVDIRHPGVKSKTLANDIAFRELRALSFPLAQALFVVDRTLYSVLPGEVLAFTNERAGLTKLPMRVKSVDYGDLLNGKITIEAVEDVFFDATGIFSPAPSTGWTSPSTTLTAFPTDEQVAFEAPRALTSRDDDISSATGDYVYASARQQTNAVGFSMVERHDLSAPSGTYTEFGDAVLFSLIGKLSSSLSAGSVTPLLTLDLTADPDTQSDLIETFPSSLTLSQLGTELTTLCLIDDEFILVQSITTNVLLVQLVNVYRGVLDSVQADHAAGASVFFLFNGSSMSDAQIASGNIVDVKLLPQAVTGEGLDVSLATEITFTMANRTRRPMPPASFAIGAVAFTSITSTSIDIDAVNAGTDDAGMLVQSIIRRDYRNDDEVAALLTDAGTTFPDFPSNNTTTVEIEILTIGGTVLSTNAGILVTSSTVRQLDFLETLGTTTLPTTLTIGLRESHIFEGTTFASRSDLQLTFTVLSALVGEHAFGASGTSVTSPAGYTVISGDESTDHIVNLSSSFTLGNVQFDLDGAASWTTIISAGGTGPGTIPNASLSIGTVITLRHTSTDTSAQKLCTMTVSSNTRGYAVFTT